MIVGAGIAGLAAALALTSKGFNVVVVDRDGEIPDGLGPRESWEWPRRSAPQAQHPHFLMGRLRTLFQNSYPDLLDEMFTAGVWELPFVDTVHPFARTGYHPKSGDDQLVPLCCRRTTLEMVMRRYIGDRGIADIRSGARVQQIISEKVGGVATAVGCSYVVDDKETQVPADVVVVASGRGTGIIQGLRNDGVLLDTEHYPSQTIYFTRHYRLRPGAEYPALFGLPGADYPDFTLGALPADNGTFTVTLSAWKDDPLFQVAGRDAEVFTRICASVPKISPWVDPDRAEPVSGMIPFASMDYLWRTVSRNGQPEMRNLFLVGDAGIRTNPKFGRGCTWGSVAAEHLAEVLTEVSDPDEQVKGYEEALWNDFRSDWETLRKIERRSRVKFEAFVGQRRRTLPLRLSNVVEGHIMNVAMSADSYVQRAIMRGYHGIDGMADWTRDPRVWLRVASSSRPSRPLRELRASGVGRPSRSQIGEMSRIQEGYAVG